MTRRFLGSLTLSALLLTACGNPADQPAPPSTNAPDPENGDTGAPVDAGSTATDGNGEPSTPAIERLEGLAGVEDVRLQEMPEACGASITVIPQVQVETADNLTGDQVFSIWETAVEAATEEGSADGVNVVLAVGRFNTVTFRCATPDPDPAVAEVLAGSLSPDWDLTLTTEMAEPGPVAGGLLESSLLFIQAAPRASDTTGWFQTFTDAWNAGVELAEAVGLPSASIAYRGSGYEGETILARTGTTAPAELEEFWAEWTQFVYDAEASSADMLELDTYLGNQTIQMTLKPGVDALPEDLQMRLDDLVAQLEEMGLGPVSVTVMPAVSG